MIPVPMASPNLPQRLVCVDALRGFDMLWICGADAVVRALAKTTDVPWLKSLAGQMAHASWTGFSFYDLIFPLFLFLSGFIVTWWLLLFLLYRKKWFLRV